MATIKMNTECRLLP